VSLEKQSPCKVNLLLNILGKRTDGFHELETVLQPVRVFDRLSFRRAGQGIQLSCSAPGLPTDARNLVYRAAAMFLEAARVRDGVRLELQKNIPLAAGLGGGSGNAATALLGLNELFGGPLAPEQLQRLAASLGSDVPFFLQDKPALATGRGEGSNRSNRSRPWKVRRLCWFIPASALPPRGLMSNWRGFPTR
jgi:4-diphosphocytidyl-2-C-methyl-D-erythritol kinase